MQHELCVTVQAPVQALVQAPLQKLFFWPTRYKKDFREKSFGVLIDIFSGLPLLIWVYFNRRLRKVG